MSARNLFVALQVALSLIALVAGGLFLESLANAQRIDPARPSTEGCTLRGLADETLS
jgi:hypothetical protein